HLEIKANTLNVSNAGATPPSGIFVFNVATTPLNLASAVIGAAELDLLSDGNITISGPVTGFGNSLISITTPGAGSITVNGAMSVSGVSGTITLNMNAGANMSMSGTAPAITANTVTLNNLGGSIGAGAAMRVNANNLSMNVSQSGSVVDNANGVTIQG